jgi:hypothetical protein
VAVAVDDAGTASVVWERPSDRLGRDSTDHDAVTSFDGAGTRRWQYDDRDPGTALHAASVVDGRLFVAGCRRPTLFGQPTRIQRGLVLEVADGEARVERELGDPDGACIRAIAPAPAGGLLVGGDTGGDQSGGGAFVVVLHPG